MMTSVSTSTLRVACIVPTFNGRDELTRLLDSLESQNSQFDLFLVDSSSSDGTLENAKARVKNVVSILGRDFNHGGTRQMMVDLNPDYDLYVFLTQDACLAKDDSIERIIAPFSDDRVGAVCGRQLPHLDASLLSQHARSFNYPETSITKRMSDAPSLGLKTAFMSNSFAAYRATALQQVGGFPNHVILSEDMYVAAKMLLADWSVAYSGDAVCRHSHNYTLLEEFRRYFDLGVFHAREAWLRGRFGSAGPEGMRYVKSELKFLGVMRLYLWPGSLLRNALKLIAYKLGQKERHLPRELKKKISMHKHFWSANHK